MKTLRLLVTDECPRSCDGCCNKQWNLNKLQVADVMAAYDEILITGGEPMLFPDKLVDLIHRIHIKNQKAEVYVYTAMITDHTFKVLSAADGITLTLHDQADVLPFLKFNRLLMVAQMLCNTPKSMRLNIFKGVEIVEPKNWKVKSNIEWIANCPLPKNETFERLEELWKRR